MVNMILEEMIEMTIKDLDGFALIKSVKIRPNPCAILNFNNNSFGS
jgi:hypothetical protein